MPLNPSAPEWAPPPKTTFPSLPSTSQPHAAVQLVAPTHELHPLHFYGFVPFGRPCIRPPPLHTYTFPVFHAAPPPLPISGAGPIKVERVAVQHRRGYIPQTRAWNVPRQRAMWRPKNPEGCDGATPSPPCRSVKVPTKTTVMIKNLPNQLSRDFMLGFLDGYCKSHSLEYDFFYLPMDFSKEKNLGYAFVNLTSVRGAKIFRRLVHNYEWGNVTTDEGTFTSKKVCEVTWAATQGKEGQMRRFENSVFACDKLEFLPVVFDPPRNGSNSDVARPMTVGALRQGFKSP